MIEINFPVVLLSALIPLVTGSLWFNPKTFGNVWMKEVGLTTEDAKKANMLKTFGFTILFSIMLAFVLQFLVIHQFHFFSMMAGETDIEQVGSASNLFYTETMAKYGNTFRTFKHGALHGFMSGILLSLPIIGTNALFEMKSWKYIFLNVGYWTLNLTLMGGVICAFPK